MGTSKMGMIEREKKILSAAFHELQKDIDTDDRKKVAKRVKLDERTIYRYWTGALEEIRDVGTAKRIIKAFRNRVIEKQKELKQLLAA